eukprot:1634545-Pleurochrysis_carterae.AAC.1
MDRTVVDAGTLGAASRSSQSGVAASLPWSCMWRRMQCFLRLRILLGAGGGRRSVRRSAQVATRGHCKRKGLHARGQRKLAISAKALNALGGGQEGTLGVRAQPRLRPSSYCTALASRRPSQMQRRYGRALFLQSGMLVALRASWFQLPQRR